MPTDRTTALLEHMADGQPALCANEPADFVLTRLEASGPMLWGEIITVPIFFAILDFIASSFFSFPPTLDTLILGPWGYLAVATFLFLLASSSWLTAASVKISVQNDELQYGWRTYSLRELSLPHLEGHGHLVVNRDQGKPLIILGAGYAVSPSAAKRSGEVAEHLNAAIMASELRAAAQALAAPQGSPYRGLASNKTESTPEP